MKTEDTIIWISSALIWASLLYGFLLTYKERKTIRTLNKIDEARSKAYVDFTEKTQKDYLYFTEEATRRLNALSKENNKLREQNEIMKERLRNLGIKDFDVI